MSAGKVSYFKVGNNLARLDDEGGAYLNPKNEWEVNRDLELALHGSPSDMTITPIDSAAAKALYKKLTGKDMD